MTTKKTIPKFEPTAFDIWLLEYVKELVFHPRAEKKKIKIFEEEKNPAGIQA